MQQLIELAGSFLWGPATLAVFLGTGLYLSFRTGFFQVTGLRTWFGQTLFSAVSDRRVRSSGDSASISQLQALTSSLAACLGTGNVIGVASAITAGGAGTVFWMWISAVLGMMTACCENILGVKYRIKDSRGRWLGGAMMYIERGLSMKRLARVFCVLLTGAAFGMGCMTQANSAAQALGSFGIPPIFTGAVLCVLTFIIISGGIGRIASFSEKLIPALTLLFMAGSFIIIAVNFRRVPSVLTLILREAFSLRAVGGFGMAKAMRYGVARGVFSNEAGLGSSPIIHSAAHTDSAAKQGLWGIAEVFLDTVFMCTVTAFTILVAEVWQPGVDNGGTLCSLAFESLFGAAGKVFIIACVCLFAFATLTAWSYYGKIGITYLREMKTDRAYNIIYALCAFIGCAVKLETVWNLADIFNALMAFPNLFAVLALSGKAIKELNSLRKPQK